LEFLNLIVIIRLRVIIMDKYLTDWIAIIDSMKNDNTYKASWGKAIIESLLEKDYTTVKGKIIVEEYFIVKRIMKYYWNLNSYFGLTQGRFLVVEKIIEVPVERIVDRPVYIDKEVIVSADLLKEGQNVEVTFHADTETPLTCELPAFVEMEITYTEPGMRGDTSSTSSLKAAAVETGATIQVPLFVNTGDRIKIDTRDHSYSERVKK